MKEYALYKGEILLIMGTLEEIAHERNIKIESVRFYGSPTYRKRTSENNGLRLVEI